MKEANEPATPRDEDTSDTSAIRDLPEPDVGENSAEVVRGGAELPTDKRRQIAHDM